MSSAQASRLAALYTCQAGFTAALRRELMDGGLNARAEGEDWVCVPAPAPQAAPGGGDEGWCFAHTVFLEPTELRAEGVNALADALLTHFCESARDERFEGRWPVVFRAASGADGLHRRAKAVRDAWTDALRRRMARVAKLADLDAHPGRGPASGFFVFFADYGRCFVTRRAVFGGQRRMADDPRAPSRSYLKVEEAYHILGRTPAESQTVADLGAAPGGWSFSAAEHGARVFAIDNGPLKGGAKDHPRIVHLKEDAYRYRPEPGTTLDWLFCDVVDNPYSILDVITRWLENRWCRAFVVNLKFGRHDPVAVLAHAAGPKSPLRPHCKTFYARHLYHDREEITLVGELRE